MAQRYLKSPVYQAPVTFNAVPVELYDKQAQGLQDRADTARDKISGFSEFAESIPVSQADMGARDELLQKAFEEVEGITGKYKNDYAAALPELTQTLQKYQRNKGWQAWNQRMNSEEKYRDQAMKLGNQGIYDPEQFNKPTEYNEQTGMYTMPEFSVTKRDDYNKLIGTTFAAAKDKVIERLSKSSQAPGYLERFKSKGPGNLSEKEWNMLLTDENVNNMWETSSLGTEFKDFNMSQKKGFIKDRLNSMYPTTPQTSFMSDKQWDWGQKSAAKQAEINQKSQAKQATTYNKLFGNQGLSSPTLGRQEVEQLPEPSIKREFTLPEESTWKQRTEFADWQYSNKQFSELDEKVKKAESELAGYTEKLDRNENPGINKRKIDNSKKQIATYKARQAKVDAHRKELSPTYETELSIENPLPDKYDGLNEELKQVGATDNTAQIINNTRNYANTYIQPNVYWDKNPTEQKQIVSNINNSLALGEGQLIPIKEKKGKQIEKDPISYTELNGDITKFGYSSSGKPIAVDAQGNKYLIPNSSLPGIASTISTMTQEAVGFFKDPNSLSMDVGMTIPAIKDLPAINVLSIQHRGVKNSDDMGGGTRLDPTVQVSIQQPDKTWVGATLNYKQYLNLLGVQMSERLKK